MKVSDVPIRASAAALDRILAAGHPTMVVFETADCSPCQALRPVLDEIAREFKNRVLVVRVADAAEGWLAARYKLVFVPTLLFFRDGREHGRIAGSASRSAIREHLDWLLNRRVLPRPAEGPRHTLTARFAPTRDEPRAFGSH